MPTITLSTYIAANLITCFDVSRNIDVHKISTAKTNEEAIAGTTSGLIGLGESVTWRATHFGLRLTLTTSITAFSRPTHFRDEQVKGPFNVMVHDHYFSEEGDGVMMQDVFRFQSPFGILGMLVDGLVLKRYLKKFLIQRNAALISIAQSMPKIIT